MTIKTTLGLVAAAMAGAAVLAIAGFVALGSIFDYPGVLDEPTGDILARYRAHQAAVSAWFGALGLGAALIAPIGVLLGRLQGDRRRVPLVVLGVGAALVQVIGLSRWILLVPRVSDDALVPGRTADAYDRFELYHRWLGTILGETVGYALTAAFTIVAAAAVRSVTGGRVLGLLGVVAAVLVATGVVIPLGVDLATLTNFAGYVAWCGWLVGAAFLLARRARTVGEAPVVGIEAAAVGVGPVV
jgi:hypothetical protein